MEIETRHKLSSENLTEEQFWTDSNNIIAPELLNNIGVLRLEASSNIKLTNPEESKKKFRKSLDAFSQAITNIDKMTKISDSGEKLKALRLTTLFNIGYWHESNHQFDQANTIYKQIIGMNPDYIDAIMRLAYLARRRGDTYRALHWIDQASKSKAKAPVNQHCLKGKMLMDLGKVNEAGDQFRFVCEKLVRGDSYCMLGLANINFHQAMIAKDSTQDMLLVKAYNKYLDILAHD